MDLSRIILGPVVTEKAERLKMDARTHTLHVAPGATKVDVAAALRAFYGIEVESVRILRTRPKARPFGKGGMMEKRHAQKRAIVTLKSDSKALDLASFDKR